MTQPYVAWLYAKTFFWPTALSGDYDLEPLSTTHDARFWIGVLFVSLLVAGALGAMFRRNTRLIGFGILWFLIALLPTSLFPLAEVMNDHRSFFPYIGLVIAAAGVASLLFRQNVCYSRPAKLAAAVALTLFLSSTLTPPGTGTRFGKAKNHSGRTSPSKDRETHGA